MLANFVSEFAGFLKEPQYKPPLKPWHVFVDNSSCWVGGRVGVHIMSNEGREYNYIIQLAFKTTNNEVEYKALLAGLTIAMSLGAKEMR